MESNPRGSAATFAAAEDAGPGGYDAVCAGEAVTKLYEAHALGLIRLAHIMLGERSSAEDVVQEAFCGLYRLRSHLADPVHGTSAGSADQRDGLVAVSPQHPPPAGAVCGAQDRAAPWSEPAAAGRAA